MLLTTLIFLLIIGLLVFVHELGHFWVAKRNGVKVEEFAFGFRPRLYGKQVGETMYAINAIPLGGYVKLYGERGEKGQRSLASKSIWQRFQILVAGSAMNFLLGFLGLTILFAVGFNPIFPGVNSNPYVEGKQQIVINAVGADSPAAKAGLKSGDVVESVNGTVLNNDQEFVTITRENLGKSINITILRDGKQSQVALTPRTNPPDGQGPVGAAINTSGKVHSTVLQAPAAALWESGRIVGLSAAAFGDFVKNLVVKQHVSDDVTGLIGIGALTGVARRLGVDYLLQLVVIISLGLGVINLMPILPLDGGHIAALGYEKAVRRPLSERQLGYLATAGLFFVLLMFIIVTYKDIIRFDVIERIF
ncbi:MAG: M50 family metallopeptidase [Patescibacteria group bacterium]